MINSPETELFRAILSKILYKYIKKLRFCVVYGSVVDHLDS